MSAGPPPRHAPQHPGTPRPPISSPPQDVFRLQTPGGGGFGSPGDGGDPEEATEPPASRSFAERGSVFEYRRAQEAV